MRDNGHHLGAPDAHAADPAELEAARRLSEQIDRLLAGEPVELADPRLAAADRLSRLSRLLPPVDSALERRIASRRPPVRRRRMVARPRLPARVLGLIGAAAVVIVAFFLTVPGQTALARLAAIFQLETVEVGINVATATPADLHRIVTPRIERPLGSLEVAQEVAPVPILVPADLPAGWTLSDVTAVYYPDLPARVPLNIVLTYRSEGGAALEIIEYFIRLGDDLTVDSLSRIDETSTSARELTVAGRRVILVESDDVREARTLIWQQAGILLEVTARNVSAQDLLAIAASVGPVD